ncbi:putative rhamnosyl transferase [Aestuariicoccus sp. MJ-SS9]|uniref:putative rhamnosyl transferase n=1 Tax=Aestuariicoccus sp. MJ-SS9 TaxID=3079855 RepID=UPI00290694E4|nr:putative rhamnosyl transferase [Aestuariicoccus sp. MJ-SS9]MDU8913652.1 putative rhamnosyl transferase [Aestuariicoccus sp. MJ-SS9]
MQVIGLCRFSYPAEGGFQVEHADLAERMAYLYAPARLEERFASFEGICLPGLRAQTDPDFTFLILIGDTLPDAALDRLRALVADLPQARIVARPPLPHRKVCQEVINAARDMTQPALEFRLDDDDTVGRDFVERLRATARDCAPLLARHRLVALDFNRGYILRADAGGVCGEEQILPYSSMGLAVAVQPRVALSVMNFAHNKLGQFMPTITQTDAPMFVRGHNEHNDSRQKKHVKPMRLPPLSPDDAAVIEDRFGISVARLARLCGA